MASVGVAEEASLSLLLLLPPALELEVISRHYIEAEEGTVEYQYSNPTSPKKSEYWLSIFSLLIPR